MNDSITPRTDNREWHPHGYSRPLHQETLDSGYSGRVAVTAAAGDDRNPVMVFVDSEHLGRLVLTRVQANELGTAMIKASGQPPRRTEMTHEIDSNPVALPNGGRAWFSEPDGGGRMLTVESAGRRLEVPFDDFWLLVQVAGVQGIHDQLLAVLDADEEPGR